METTRPEIPLDDIDILSREELIKIIKETHKNNGLSLNFYGKRAIKEIYKRVRPRIMREDKNYSCGPLEERAKNLLVDGENLQAMVTLYKYRGQIDLILTDPPYNTGQSFRYNDKWDEDPNDPDLGSIVRLEDGSRHTKWMKMMLPRLYMMWKMLKPNGVIAICIDENELYHLGMMMDEVFGENNRIAIINWQKTYSPKSQETHVSTATEYVLVYAKDKEIASTNLLARTEEMDKRYWNPDNDPEGAWKKQGDPTAKDPAANAIYGVQSPFSGEIYYPSDGRHWSHTKSDMKKWLSEWGIDYVEKDIKDNKGKALLIKGIRFPFDKYNSINQPILNGAKEKAEEILTVGVWPRLHFGINGNSAPNLKRYLKHVQQGKVPLTYWASEDYDEPTVLGSQSWDFTESGHSEAGIKELTAMVGEGHNFTTVKPLKLIKKIIQLWCPPNGIVMDPFAGSGTTGHAVLELNHETKTDRRFILIEQGRPETGDKYTRSLTYKRLIRAITGERVNKNGDVEVKGPKIDSGFDFYELTNLIDAKVVMSMRKDELIDVIVTSHWEDDRRSAPNIIRIIDSDYDYKHLLGKNEKDEGYFVILNGNDTVGSLDIDTYEKIVEEARMARLTKPYHVYARYEVFQSQSVKFYKIPDKILAHLGLNEDSDSYNED